MPFATAVATETTRGTSVTMEKPAIPMTMKPTRILLRPIVLRMAQLSS
jgi:hypothetical protein